jgi:hypothetical protein
MGSQPNPAIDKLRQTNLAREYWLVLFDGPQQPAKRGGNRCDDANRRFVHAFLHSSGRTGGMSRLEGTPHPRRAFERSYSPVPCSVTQNSGVLVVECAGLRRGRIPIAT